MGTIDRSWIEAAAAAIAGRAERELEALVGVSSPSGDVPGAEEAVAITAALLPDGAAVERLECSTGGYAQDLLARLLGTGSRRILLLGHLDTVIPHERHRPLEHIDGRLVGSGTIDMKGGIVLALGVLKELAAAPEAFGELVLLAVTDEEWRTGAIAHGPLFSGFDACLCFEGGDTGPAGEDAVVVRRKAASTMRVTATGVAAHSGASPENGRNALLALGEAARVVAAANDPQGPQRVTAVPTIMRSGDAFNVVPASGELFCDLRGDELGALERIVGTVPAEHEGVALEAELVRRWRGMDTRERAAPLLAAAGELIGRPVLPAERGGASDASHLAADVPLTIDGLGPLGGGAHNPDEYVLADSLGRRAEVALALTVAALGGA